MRYCLGISSFLLILLCNSRNEKGNFCRFFVDDGKMVKKLFHLEEIQIGLVLVRYTLFYILYSDWIRDCSFLVVD